MYRKCTTEISIRHQKQITESLLALMQKTPYEEITVTQLCQAAGVTRRIFYHLFNNKTDALYALIDHTILEGESYGSELRDELLRFFCYWRDHRSFLDALRDNHLTGILQERMLECIFSEDFDFRYWLKTNGWEERDVIVFHLSGIMGLVFRWYYSDFRESPEEMAALLKKIVTTPLARE